MNRREFIKHVALLTAASALSPEQLFAREAHLAANAVPDSKGLILANEIYVSGMCGRHYPASMDIFTRDELELHLCFNAMGTQLVWNAVPGQELRITTLDDFKWSVKGFDSYPPRPGKEFDGYVRYMDQEGFNHVAVFSRMRDYDNLEIKGTLRDLVERR